MLRRLLLSLVVFMLPQAASAAVMRSAQSVGSTENAAPVRAVQVDLDYVWDADQDQQERNIQDLVERIKSLGINVVFLQGFANPEGDGLARSLYFPNASLPMRADLFSRVTAELKTRANVKVFGWLPVLSFDLGDTAMPVMAWNPKTNQAEIDPKAYRRVSPFDMQSKEKIGKIYEAMAQAADIDGILFHDDALLSDFEDASPLALKAYHANGLPGSIKDIRSNPKLMKKWADFKTTILIAYTQDLAERVRKYRSPITTVRNLYAKVALTPESQIWFAQNYDRFLKAYDYTAIEAMPMMENVPDDQADDWMHRLVVNVAARPNGLKHTIFELQSVDWRKQAKGEDRAIPTEVLSSQMRQLTEEGALNFGYYPDDFVTNTPDVDALRQDFSIQTVPYSL